MIPQPPNPPDLPHSQRPASHQKIQRVPKLLKDEKNRDNYIPMVVSIGPYHHGKPQLRSVESFKPTAKCLFFLGSEKKEDYYYEEIKKKINDIRNCYETVRYKDEKLVQMMLLDACFIIIYMETSCIEGRPKSAHENKIAKNARDMFDKLRISIMSTVLRDMFLLENQIPLWIIKLLLKSRYNDEELLHRYMTTTLYGDFRAQRNVPTGYPEELHLLEAFHRLVVYGFVRETKNTCLSFINRKFFCCFEAKEKTTGDPNADIESGMSSQGKHAKGDFMRFINSFCSVTDLKAAGIHFKPNQTLSLKDVKFESNCIFGKLQLPFWCVRTHTKVFFMNMIAYELSLNDLKEAVVTAYIDTMKSLIVRPEDVKELREKKILCDMLGNDEEILKVYQDINTLGASNSSIFTSNSSVYGEGKHNASVFDEVKHKIQAYCNSKGKRWIAELVNTYFRSPWTFITLLAATCLLVLTALQTIYTMKNK